MSGPPSDVGSHPTDMGGYGSLDLGGGASEWVEDVFDEYAYVRTMGPPAFCDPIIQNRWSDGSSNIHVVRGCNYLCGTASTLLYAFARASSADSPLDNNGLTY